MIGQRTSASLTWKLELEGREKPGKTNILEIGGKATPVGPVLEDLSYEAKSDSV